MQEAPIPDNEAARLRALHGLEILDTLPEQAYDDITFIASRLCSTPIALVSLVDADRQWFKSKVGLDVHETPRALAFCAHSILEPRDIFVVEDARADERFADNPLVTGDPRIRFYAGAPLVTGDGHALGTLCVIDQRPRRPSDDELMALRALSRQVVAHLELRRANQQLAIQSRQLTVSLAALDERGTRLEKSRDELEDLCQVLEGQVDRIEQDLSRAETIQRSLLPQTAPEIPDFCVQTLYRPGLTIGGDLFDVQCVSDRYVAVVIADAVGHGVSAAMLSLLFKHRLTLTDETSGEPLAPSEVLTRINTALLEDIPAPGVFVTTVCGLLDTRERKLRLASAGHPPALLLRATGATEQFERTGPALGLYPDAVFQEHAIDLAQGDRLLLYTDGLFDGDNESPARLQKIADRLRALDDGGEVLDQVLESVCGGARRADRDDVTMLLLEAKPGVSHFSEAGPPRTVTPAPFGEEPPITYAETTEGTYLALHGRMTWLHASALLNAATAVIEARRPLRLDLGRCEYLDSTLLGTLHEIAIRADAAGIPLHVHGARTELRQAFGELHMRALVQHLVNEPLPVPPRTRPVPLSEVDVQSQQLRLLKAHEMLAELNEENRDEFAEVIAELRAGLGKR